MPKKTSTRKKGLCDCVKKVNAKLKPDGLELDTKLQLDFLTGKGSCALYLPTRKLADSKSRKSPPPVMLNFCPFCGEPYA